MYIISHTDLYFSLFLTCTCEVIMGKILDNAINVTKLFFVNIHLIEYTLERNHINAGNVQRHFHPYVIFNGILKDILKRSHINPGIVSKLFKEKWSYKTFGNTFCRETISREWYSKGPDDSMHLPVAKSWIHKYLQLSVISMQQKSQFGWMNQRSKTTPVWYICDKSFNYETIFKM